MTRIDPVKTLPWGIRLGQALDQILIRKEILPFTARVQEYEALKRRYLETVSSQRGRLEIRRRIAEELVRLAVDQEWPVFRGYLNRLERLRFARPDSVALAFLYVAKRQDKENPERRKTAERLLARARRMLKQCSAHINYKHQETAFLNAIERNLL
jgi:hypothetical protein